MYLISGMLTTTITAISYWTLCQASCQVLDTDRWGSRVGDRWGQTSKASSLPPAHKLLLCDPLIGTSRIQTPVALLTVMLWHRNTRWQCYLFPTAKSSSSRKLLPWLSEKPTQPPAGDGMAEGAGQAWLPVLSSLYISSLKNTISPWYGFKKN